MQAWTGGTGGPGGIVTPEAVPLDLEPATVGSRGVAYLLDLVLIGVAVVVLVIAGFAAAGAQLLPGWVATVLVLLLVFAVQLGYPIGFETLWHGRTPGKVAMGLRVVTVEGAPVGFRHVAIRAAVGLLELPGTAGAIAILTALVSARGQRLGDLAAGTIVLRERRRAAAPRAHRFAAPPGLETYVAQLDVTGIGPEEYAAIRDVLVRVPGLPAPARTRVTEELAGTLHGRVRPAAPAGISAEAWLSCVAAAVQARSQRPAGAAASPGAWGPPPAPPPSSGGVSGPPPQAAPPPPGRAPGPPPAPRPGTTRPSHDPPDTGFAPPG